MKRKITGAYLAILTVLVASTLTGCIHERPLSATNKIEALLQVIEQQYVDTVDIEAIVEQTLPKVLSELDPHSVYIPAQKVEESNQELKGSFSGIGIQFMIQSDTIYVSNIIHGGPAEKVGLMAGDRIVTIDDSLYVGKKISNDGAMKRLKGPKGSEVRLGIKRYGEKELLTYTIKRGNIPVKSVDATYMIDDRWCYIKINKFGETTYPEMLIALAQGIQKGTQGCIIDLRGNTGGYMGAAIQMVNEFLPKGKLIVYTEGRKSARENYFSNGTGSSQHTPIIVLVDEGSASASEIFAGAIQDNDRGTIIGRRSFGKGLVQQPIDFSDGSAIRLTIARYHTPSGRCIQKPYTKGKDANYDMDILTRYEHGEFFSQDSIKQDESHIYYTSLGRPVYGGGGIMPDIFVPLDTLNVTKYFSEVSGRNILYRYTIDYSDRHRKALEGAKNLAELKALLDGDKRLFTDFVRYAERQGVKPNWREIERSRKIMEAQLRAYISRNSDLEENAFYYFIYPIDRTILRAIEELQTEN